MSDSDMPGIARVTPGEAKLIRRIGELAKRLNIYLNHFPRHEKYALSNRIRNTLYEVYDLVVEGEKRYHKKTVLTNLDIAHERLRMQLWLANELGYFCYERGATGRDDALAARRYLTINRMVDEIGRMIGGWISSKRDAS